MEHKTIKLTLLATMISGSLNLQAQAASDKKVERIQVTGSHIRRADMEGPSPIITLSAQDIAKTGVTDLIGLFSKLPSAGNGTFSTQGNSSDGTGNGGSSVSLRGLGADSTLILINGRRVSVSPFANNIDTAFVDINNIPLAAIKRVDILKDGASATYGSDAIAGVINIILKDDYEGAELSGRVGDTADGGGAETNVSLLWGNSSEKASHTFVLDYFDRDEIMGSDRAYAATANQAGRTGLRFASDQRSSSGFPGTIALASDPSNRMPDTFGNDVCPADQIVGNLCRYDYAPHGTLVPASERFSFFYTGKYEINDNLRAFADLNGQNAKTTIRGAASPSFNELFMSGDNVNHPFANDELHPFFGQDLTMRRRMVDIGNREKQVSSNYYRGVIGLEGELSEWNWDVAYSYIKSDSVERGVDGFPNSRRAQEAIDNGSWNPFEPTTNSQETLDFIETQTTRYGKSTNKSFDGQISGGILDMPAGELMLAVGAEYREETISDNPDDQFLRGDVFGTEATQANGERDNTALYAELSVPVLDNIEVQLAVRHEDYSDFGTTTDPKIAFIWTVNDDISLRGSFGTAFRAPSLHQIGLGNTQESPSLVDTVRCEAVGNDVGVASCDPFEYTAILSGNPDLGPEESESYNLGLIYQITDDIDLSLDFYNYDIENIITKDTQFKMTTFGGDASVVQRLPAVGNDPGEVIQIFDQYENIGNVETSGLDFDIGYKMDSSIGEFKFAYTLNYVLKYEDTRPTANADGSQGPRRLDTEAGDYEQPEFRWNINTSWVKNDWNASLAINYIDAFKQDDSVRIQKVEENDIVIETVILDDVDSILTVDTVINYIGLENTVLTIGATNLLNEDPSFSYLTPGGYSNVHSTQGRFVYAQATYKF
jgi:iron complex outermembrane receptor protein